MPANPLGSLFSQTSLPLNPNTVKFYEASTTDPLTLAHLIWGVLDPTGIVSVPILSFSRGMSLHHIKGEAGGAAELPL